MDPQYVSRLKIWPGIGRQDSEYTYLRLNFLPIHIAIPRACVKTNKAFDRLKTLGRRFITPCSVRYDLFVVVGGLEIPIRRAPFPFAEGRVRGGVQREGKRRARKIIGWEKSAT